MERMMKQDGGFRPRLQIVEMEGHGRAFEVYEDGEYVATFDQRDGREVRYPNPPGPTIGERFGGRVAEVYGYKAYEAACAKVMEADPEGWDVSDVMPAPFLVIVKGTTAWEKLTEEQADAVRTLLEDSVNMIGPWGLPNDIVDREMSEDEWREALDAGLARLTP